jgi:hypothetical protein
MPRVSFSNSNVDVAYLALHHTDVESSLRNYFSANAPSYTVPKGAGERVPFSQIPSLKVIDAKYGLYRR